MIRSANMGLWVLAHVCAWAAVPALAATVGEIDGQGAVVVVPRDGAFGAGCRAHVIFEGEPESEAVFPCGEYFLPPAHGRMLRAWAEQGDAMSPHPERFVPRDSPPGTLMTVTPFAPAGRVVLAIPDAGPGIALRLLDADPLPLRAGRLPPELLRSLTPDRWQEGALMPAGHAVAWLWDVAAREVIALSRPFEVAAGKAVAPHLTVPGRGSQLIAELIRTPESGYEHDEEMAIELELGGKTRKPDLVVPTTFKVYAFFFDLEIGEAGLKAETPSTLLPLQRLALEAGRIHRLSAQLVRRPELEVELGLPPELLEERPTLEVFRVADLKQLESRRLTRNSRREIFENLPADLLAVQLVTTLGTFVERVDMSDALDASVRIEPRIIAISGTVYLEDEGHPARLIFKTAKGEDLEVFTDPAGSYQLLALESLKFVEVEPEGGASPHVDFFQKPLDSSRTLDFRLEAKDFRVKVLARESRRPIAGARVALRNSFPAEVPEGEKPPSGLPPQKILSQSVTTDDTGEALLPQLRAGDLELKASAIGYRRSPKPTRFQVEEADREKVFELLLDPEGPAAALILERPDGSPADGAEIILVADLAAGQPVHSAKADRSGRAEIPRQPGFLLVRHPEAASQVFPWPPQDESGSPSRLAPSAEVLVLKVEDGAGRPAAGAHLAIWLEGRKLSGPVLAFLSRSRDSADQDGFARLTNLPRSPILVLAWAKRQSDTASRGELDQQATRVDYPWPIPSFVQIID